MPVLLPLLALLAPLGCSDKSVAADDTATVAEPIEPCETPCALSDDNNFSYAADLDVTSVPLEEYGDVVVDWSGLTTNFYGKPIDPAVDIEEAWLVVFTNQTADEVAEGIANDTLDQGDISLYTTCESKTQRCALSEFNIGGVYPNPQTYFEDEQGAWLVSLLDASSNGFHSLMFLDADPSASGTAATFDDGTALLQADVDLASLDVVHLQEGAELELDWGGLTTDPLGNEVAVHKLDELLLGRYDQDLETLQDEFFFLRDIAAETWGLGISERTEITLDEVEGDTPFTGITDEGTWLLALFCTTCQNPAPRFLTVLAPAPSEAP